MSLSFIISCHNDFEVNEEIKPIGLHNNYEILNGTIKIESKQKLKNILDFYQKDIEGQNEFNDEIRAIQENGFMPLTPVFDENDTKKIESFLIAKKQKTQKINSEYGILNKENEEEDVDFDVEDNLIQDPRLAAMLNENRELIIGDSLYKYTEHGLYFCLEKDKQKLYNSTFRLLNIL